MRGTPLNFTRGMEITGDSAIINLNNHYMAYLDVSLNFAIINLENIRTINKTIDLLTGLYSDTLSSDISSVLVKANQPKGNICINAPSLV